MNKSKMALTLEIIQNKAKERGGEVLSKRYSNVHTKLQYRCKEGHVWHTCPTVINMGSWCPRCGNNKKGEILKFSIKEIKVFAESNGGKCLSMANDYKNVLTRLKWRCSKGHNFEESYHNVRRRKNWCKKCREI